MTKAETRQWLEAQILAEHSKAQTMRIVHWVGHDTERLEEHLEHGSAGFKSRAKKVLGRLKSEN